MQNSFELSFMLFENPILTWLSVLSVLASLFLLGKHSDIGLFTDRSEITINYKNPEDLENAIKERVKRLLNADVLDVTPLSADLDEELGVFTEPDESDLVKEPGDGNE